MENFTPISALIGGLMIGTSAVILLSVNGKIAGISGILAGLLQRPAHEGWWRAAFILGLIGVPVIILTLDMGFTVPALETDPALLIIAGLLVGIGVRMGGGCTSGHGVCGIGRLSVRSIVGTCIFMAAAGVTVYVTRHVMGGL